MGDKTVEERVAVLETEIKNTNGSVSEIKDTLKWFARFSFMTFVSTSITLIIMVMK